MLCPLDVYTTQDQLGGMADISRLLPLWLFVIPCHYCGKSMYTGHTIACGSHRSRGQIQCMQ